MGAKVQLWTKDFILICVAQLAVSICFMSTSTVLPLFLEEFLNIGGLLLGVVVACYTVTTVVCRPFVGYLIDRLGRKVIYLPSYLLFGGLFFFYPFAGALAGMIFLRLAHGVFWGANLAAAGPVVVDIVPMERRGEGLGIFGLTACIGMALGPALGVMIISEFGYKILFIGCGIFLLLFFIISLTVHIPKIPYTHGKFTFNGLIEKSSLPMGMIMLILALPYGGLTTYAAKYTASGEVDASAGIFFLSLAAGMALCRILAGKSFDRSGPVGIMACCFIFNLTGYLLLALTRGEIPFYAAGFALGLGYGIAFPVCAAMINHLVNPQRRGAANATFWTLFDIGLCLGIVFAGFTQEALGWRATQYLQAATILAAAALFRSKSLPHYFHTLHTSRPEITPIKRNDLQAQGKDSTKPVSELQSPPERE